MERLYRLIYTSWALNSPSDSQLQRILAKSRANNRRSGLTGMLGVWNGIFAQCLEGPRDSIDATFDRIRRDGRHRDITVIYDEAIEDRHFGDWSMQMVRLDHESPVTEFIRRKYPKPDSASCALFSDPLVIFSLLFDLGVVSKGK